MRTLKLLFPAVLVAAALTFSISCKKEGTHTSTGPDTTKNPVKTATDTIPLSNAYGVPNEDNINIADDGTHNWTSNKDTARVYATFNKTGALNISILAKAPAGNCTVLIEIDDKILTVQVPQNANYKVIPAGSINISNPGIKAIQIIGKKQNGGYFPDMRSLLISGQASIGAWYNKSAYRTCASVHDGYNIPSGDTAAWFYNEINVHPGSDIVNTFFMANGFYDGYFGIQVNSPTERRIIFSIWSDYDTNNPNEVPSAYAVTLVAKGAMVTTEETFGNEGTGRHSIAVYPWVTGTTYKFLVHSVPDANGITYSGFIFLNNKWNLVAKYYKPIGNANMDGLYSFIEDFGVGLNSYKQRSMTMQNQYIVTPHGKWVQLTGAYFTTTTHDDNFSRTDYGNAINGAGYNMFTGGFVPQTATDNQNFTCNPGNTPNVTLPE